MMRGIWDRETVALLLIVAYLPLAGFWLWYGGAEALARFALAVLVVAVWNLTFLLARAQVPSLVGVLTAFAFAMLAPTDIGAFRLVLGLSFGIVVGELIFGGWGRNVVNPATIALAFMGFGFPGFDWPGFVTPVIWAAIPVVVLGMAMGLMAASQIVSAMVIACACYWMGLASTDALLLAGLVFVLLGLDPVTSPSTVLGRWLGGGLYAGLAVLFAAGWDGAAPVQYAVAAALLTSLSAPLLDEIALALWVAQRRRRHGRT